MYVRSALCTKTDRRLCRYLRKSIMDFRLSELHQCYIPIDIRNIVDYGTMHEENYEKENKSRQFQAI